MKNRFRFTILLLLSCLLLSQGTMTAFAETEGSTEGEVNTNQSQELSMDDTLSSLKIAQAALSPEFSPNQLTYTATVPYEVERVALTAQTNSPEARKVIRGTSDLKVGENLITVTVTAENGFVREYRITLIRKEMPETTPSEGGETQETPAIDENDPQDETAESVTEESQDMTPEETVSEETTQDETVMPPQDTKPSGGMVIETTKESPWDWESLLVSPMFMIGLVGAIVLLVLIIIVVAVIVLREKLSRSKDVDDDDDEDMDIADSHDDDSNDNKERKDNSDTIALVEAQMVSQKEIVVLDWDDDFEDAVQEGFTSKVMAAEDDLDDDFEMLLEDDDDFDFLDF